MRINLHPQNLFGKKMIMVLEKEYGLYEVHKGFFARSENEPASERFMAKRSDSKEHLFLQFPFNLNNRILADGGTRLFHSCRID